MTAGPEELKARAQRACDRSIGRTSSELREPPDAEELARLERAVLSLPRTTREVFLSHRLDNRSYTEIAAAMGISERQVERRIAEALYRISRYLDGEETTRWWHGWRLQLPRWFR